MLDPADPVTIGAMVGPEAFTEVKYLAHAKQMLALDVIPEVAAEFAEAFGRESGGLLRGYRAEGAETIVVALGSVLGTIEEIVDEMREQGVSIGALGDQVVPAVPARGGASGARGGEAGRRAREGARGRRRRDRLRQRADGALRHPAARLHRDRRPRWTPDHQEALHGLFADAVADRLEPLSFLDLDWDRVERELLRMQGAGRTGPHAENILREARHRRGEVALTMRAREPGNDDKTPPGNQPVKFYQAGSFVVGNRLLDPEQRSVQARMERSNTLTSGHRACQGCGEALGARYALDAAMRATDGQLIAANATGCLEVFSTPYPESSWQLPWIHSLFGNAPAVATGIAAALKAKGREDIRVVGQGGDGGTLDIGFACLSGMFERNDDVLFICYDNEAYMNTGVQRSGATPPAARTANTKPIGDQPGNDFGQGKNAPLIAMAHEIPYVATATVADLRDLEYKVERAMAFRGARYLHVFVPCPLGWGAEARDTIKIARLVKETGIFPVFEAEDGEVTGVSKIRRQVPVEEYLKPQRRYAHLFGEHPRPDVIARIQASADRNIRRFGLLTEDLASCPPA